jgi:hypothetical protein
MAGPVQSEDMTKLFPERVVAEQSSADVSCKNNTVKINKNFSKIFTCLLITLLPDSNYNFIKMVFKHESSF